jgi:UDP:flavonoid glycosyltransferase YjiC (YdhE family)
VDFIQAGPPPVYLGYGSLSAINESDSTALMLRALEIAGQRGVILLPGEEAASARLPENVFAVQSVPHDWLFPRMAAVVHHGGAGTTAAGLRAGKPAVVVPFLGDQFFWGDRIFRLGVGPKPLRARQLTAEKLARAITAATTDERMARRAAAIGQRIRAEDGVARAVEAVESIVGPGGPAQME